MFIEIDNKIYQRFNFTVINLFHKFSKIMILVKGKFYATD